VQRSVKIMKRRRVSRAPSRWNMKTVRGTVSKGAKYLYKEVLAGAIATSRDEALPITAKTAGRRLPAMP